MYDLLNVKGLKTAFKNNNQRVSVVNGVDFGINKGEIVGIVGESGCGKSVTSLSIMRLLHDTTGDIQDGKVTFKGENLLDLSERSMRKIRGKEIAMIFQEPMTSLNPVMKIGKQLMQGIILHLKYSKEKAKKHAIDTLKSVGIPRAEDIMNEYPHQLSGGMRQRVMIAIAMSCEPELLIADEPTTALDVTIQAQILELMKRLQSDRGTAILMITHDLGVVAEVCDRVIVMYAGRVVEEASVDELFESPRHPYTKDLIESVPKIGERKSRLYSIPGHVPNPNQMPNGCKFAPRCQHAMEICFNKEPELTSEEKRKHRCWLYQQNNVGREQNLGSK
ncbi:peptide/nickel transport system ATP-binding protein [Scopulibacillus darangshiensis]|uniref:Peptide/nickel transport system ATP-binding protein n=1 Tax=Scopulibacillus darangshiensis TaxID=442528 RepID=A0A4R2P6X1_9BACL|nr:ABC transporter ATP-binding protein [Scopulibacillus darangshiensis]TCP29555.1 peptide/nickel transport system ATP-binding protein [Scopulibacillus darangshiensis]